MNHSTCLHPDFILPMTSPEVTMRSSHDPSVESTGTRANEDVEILAWEAALNDTNDSLSEVMAGANDKQSVEHENFPTKSCCLNDGDLIIREGKSAVRNLVVN